MSAVGAQYAGDVDIQEALLVSPTGNITDLTKDVIINEINIFEDMFRSSISGNMVITDTNDIVTKVPIVGQEYLTLKIVTPTLRLERDMIDFTDNPFAVHKVTLRKEISSGGQIYQLKFISQEAIKSSQRKISKSYYDKNANIGDIVFDLLAQNKDGVQTSKKVFIEPTLGRRPYVIPNINPFNVITKLSNEAVAESTDEFSGNPSPHYLFFENKDGIHFRSLQSLYNQPVKETFHVGDIGFDEKVVGGDKDSGKLIQNFRRILEYEIKTRKDLFVNSASGMLGGRTISHDIYKKNYTVTEYNYLDDDDFEKYGRISEDEASAFRVYNTDRFLSQDFSKSITHLVPVSKTTTGLDANYTTSDNLDGSTDPSNLEENYLQRQSRMMELSNGVHIQATVNGRTNLTAGDMVFITVPSIRGNDPDNPFYTGRYIVRALRHTIAPTVRQHLITMEITRDTSPSDFPSFGSPYEDLSPTIEPTQV